MDHTETMSFAFPIADLKDLLGEDIADTLDEMFGTDTTHLRIRITPGELHAKALTEDEILAEMREDEDLDLTTLNDIFSQ